MEDLEPDVDLARTRLSRAAQDYLKAVLAVGRGKPVGTSELAASLGVSPASATAMTKRLARAGLLKRRAYRDVALTSAGRLVAVELVRHHRLIEQFLHKALGVPWDRVHDEAERWEHVISEDVERRIDEMLGFPTHDPHGAPIPSRKLEFDEPDRTPLSAAPAGATAVVVEVRDDDPDLLRYVGGLDLYPGTRLRVEAAAPFDGGPVTVRVEAGRGSLARKVVDGRAAAVIYFERAEG